MQIIWIIGCAFIATISELFLGRMGFLVPVLPLCAFYFSITFGWRFSYIPFLVAGTILDIFYARSFPCFFLFMPLLYPLVSNWKNRGDCQQPLYQLLPGGICGLLYGVLLVGMELLITNNNSLTFGRGLWLIFQATITATLLTPIICLMLDKLARSMDLRTYYNAQLYDEDEYGK